VLKVLGLIFLILGLLLVFGMDVYSKKKEISADKKILIKSLGLILVLSAFWIIVKMV